jgi:hypothetical protein
LRRGGFFAGYDARLEAGLKRGTAKVWTDAFRSGRGDGFDASTVLRAVDDAENRDDPSVSEREFAALLAGSSAKATQQSSPAVTRGRALALMWGS